MFTLPNLISTGVTRGEPWKFKGEVPPEIRKDKAARDAWINSPETRWNVYSFVEGLNENRRITLGKGNEDDANPPYRLHAFTADYDSPIPDADYQTALKGFPYQPRFIERTLSGNLRLIWLLEEPLLIPSAKFGRHFQQKVLEFFPAGKLLPAFDKGAWTELNRYYTNSGDWTEFPDAKPIPADRLRGWMVKIGAKFEWDKETGAAEIPFEALRPALAKKYPRFAEWPGEFALDEAGPSFWIDDSASPKSALVRPTGIQTFSAHAAKGFYTWADLLGLAFVQEYQADQMGRAVKEIYHDPRGYWRKLSEGDWKQFDKTDTRDFLSITRGVSYKCDKGGHSDLDRAMLFIQQEQSVDAAGAFVFKPSGAIRSRTGQRLLNISTRKVLAPSGEKGEVWGAKGKFPVLSELLDGFFDPPEQKPHFLSWLAVYYRSGYEQNPQSGQNVFICGGVGVGKTLINQEVIGALVGGSGQAQQFLLGNDAFGGELFGFPHWMVDDAVFSSAESTKRKFSEMLKNMAASSEHRYHEKFKMPCFVEWLGRIVVTCNADPESIRAIPELNGSILDKLMLFRAVEKPSMIFPSKAEMREILKRELPHFAQWLLDYVIPEHIRGISRWAVEAYHEKSLLSTAEKGSYTSGFLDILTDWKQEYFGAQEPKAEFWEGSSFGLQKAILTNQARQQAMKSYDVNAITRQLISLQKKGHRIDSVEVEGASSFRWRIYKEDRTSQAKYDAMNSDSH